MRIKIFFFFLFINGAAYAQTIDTAMAARVAEPAVILTPKPGPAPRINGPKVFGVRPGHPIVFTVPATGTRPMAFTADKLPAGVMLDKNTGRLSGTLTKPGKYVLRLHARNKAG